MPSKQQLNDRFDAWLAWICGAAVGGLAFLTLHRRMQGDTGRRTYLDVPYEAYDTAKEFGAL